MWARLSYIPGHSEASFTAVQLQYVVRFSMKYMGFFFQVFCNCLYVALLSGFVFSDILLDLAVWFQLVQLFVSFST